MNEFNFVCVIVRGILSNVTEGLLWCNDMVRRASSRDFIQRNATVQLVHQRHTDADKEKISQQISFFDIFILRFMFSGDVTIDCSDDAQKYQNKIEETLQSKLGFKLKTGDSILTHFDSMSLHSAKKSRSRRKSKVFER